jgi:hypothetical protein
MTLLWNRIKLWRRNCARQRTIPGTAPGNRPQLEQLEDRDCPSTTVNLVGGVLKIQADPSSFSKVAVTNYNPAPANPWTNLLLVSTSGAWADSPKTTYTFLEGTVKQIQFFGSNAGDRFEDLCTPDMFNIPCQLTGANGSNYLRGGFGAA